MVAVCCCLLLGVSVQLSVQSFQMSFEAWQ